MREGSNCERQMAEALAGAPVPVCEPAACRHEQFAAAVAVNRFEDTGRFSAEIRVVCVQCREPFRAIGVQPGIAWDHPTCNIDGLERHLVPLVANLQELARR